MGIIRDSPFVFNPFMQNIIYLSRGNVLLSIIGVTD